MVLSHIRKVAAGEGLSDVLLREYFTSRLPSHVQPFMVQFPDDKPLDELAALTDKLFELPPEPPQGNIAIPVPITHAPVTQLAPVVANPAVSAHSDQSLREEIRSLALAFAELKADVKAERNSRSDTVAAIQAPTPLPVPHYVEGGVHYIQPGARYVEPQDQYQRQNRCDATVSPFLSVLEIGAWKVKCRLPANQITSVGAIGPFGKDTSSEELTEALIDAGFGRVTVERIYKGKNKIVTSFLKVVFNTTTLPQFVRIGYQQYRVSTYIGKQWQCFRCQRFGHDAVNCRAAPRCVVCSRAHNSRECPSPNTRSC
ncbi:Zinc finger CCHC-type [Trinorchestia longiramus]|nr:Zinc finger CCHC-type [Trinorchestia longiramus]